MACYMIIKYVRSEFFHCSHFTQEQVKYTNFHKKKIDLTLRQFPNLSIFIYRTSITLYIEEINQDRKKKNPYKQ